MARMYAHKLVQVLQIKMITKVKRLYAKEV